MKRGKWNVVIGGQAGSESKGKCACYLVHKYGELEDGIEAVSMTASPNAGHTYVSDSGKKMVSYHLPISGVVNLSLNRRAIIVLGPASLINPTILAKEIHDLGVDPDRVFLDPRASIITTECLESECLSSLSDIGSTLQGVGEARMRKMMRGHKGRTVQAKDSSAIHLLGLRLRHTDEVLYNLLHTEHTILHEMTQGFDLDLEHGISPLHCTSKMINTAMGMAEMGVAPAFLGDVWGVIRPYPIRVSNRTGYSGGYEEAEEISWDTIATRAGVPDGVKIAEITTTTKLPRRVFEFSWERFMKFVRVCGPTRLCLQFGNYLDWEIAGEKEGLFLAYPKVGNFVLELEKRSGVPVSLVGTGPKNCEMIEPS